MKEKPRQEEEKTFIVGETRVNNGNVGLARLNHLSFFFFPFLSLLLFPIFYRFSPLYFVRSKCVAWMLFTLTLGELKCM